MTFPTLRQALAWSSWSATYLLNHRTSLSLSLLVCESHFLRPQYSFANYKTLNNVFAQKHLLCVFCVPFIVLGLGDILMSGISSCPQAAQRPVQEDSVLIVTKQHHIPDGNKVSVKKILSWPKSLFGIFCTILWKNPNEIFGQPNSKLPESKNLLDR